MKYQLFLGLAVLLIVGVMCEEKATETDSTTCVPGEEYQVGCNSCKCPDNGKKDESACTLKACPDEVVTPTVPTNPVEPADPEKCQPGTTFQKDDCNTCTCPEDGSKAGAACTTIACEPKKE